MRTMTFPIGLIRPWYRGLKGDHISADCPTLARETDTPDEGVGWLHPGTADARCPDCFTWNAECDCGASLLHEEGNGPHDKAAAQAWAREHFCLPRIDYRATPRLQPVSTPIPAGQAALFDIKETS